MNPTPLSPSVASSLESLKYAVELFSKFMKEPCKTDRDRAGAILGFYFTFEHYWKTFQELAETEGMTIESPKQAIKAAARLGVIGGDETETWYKMLDDRNALAQTYDTKKAHQIFDRAHSNYLGLLEKTLNRFADL